MVIASTVAGGRAIRPAYEGIETMLFYEMDEILHRCRAIRPAYEGIETYSIVHPYVVQWTAVARSAPLMRGLKQHQYLQQKHSLSSKSRDPPRL